MCLVANSLPAINDVTADEMQDVLRRAAHMCEIVSSAIAAGLDRVLEEGLPARYARHQLAAERLVTGLDALGFVPLVAAADRLPMLTSVKLPENVRSKGEAAVRTRLLREFGIEIGAGLGPLAGEIWRIGLMGENARPEPVDRLLEALHKILD